MDWNPRLCPGGAFTDRLGPVDDARPDGLHFSDAGADWVADWLAPELRLKRFSSRCSHAQSTRKQLKWPPD